MLRTHPLPQVVLTVSNSAWGDAVLELLRNGSFRNLWIASLLSALGSQVSKIGLLLYLFDTRGEVISIALLVVLETLPGAVAAPLAGAVVDGMNKQKNSP